MATNFRVAIIRNGMVEDILIVTGGFKPPDGTTAVPSDTANIGNRWDGKQFLTSVSPQQKNVLLNYASRKQRGIAASGISVTFPGMVIKVDTSNEGRADLAGLVTQAQTNPNFTDTWVQQNGSFEINATQILQISSEVQNFISQVYQIYGRVVNAIEAGSITAIPEIDNPETVVAGTMKMQPWPSSS